MDRGPYPMLFHSKNTTSNSIWRPFCNETLLSKFPLRSSSTCTRREVLGITRTPAFTGQMPPTIEIGEQWQYEALIQTTAWPYTFFIHNQTPNEKGHYSLYASSDISTCINKKLTYRRVTARCVLSVVILPTATQQCRNYLYDKSWPNRWYEVGGLVGGNVS